MSRSPASPGTYRAPAAVTESELREKGSRFLAVVAPVADEEEAALRLEELRTRYRDATHHCWAQRIGWPPRERSSDAGEPSGTAGAPILSVLQGREISDALVVVIRWFGGTKLGKGGLARAYRGATRDVIEQARLEERFPTSIVVLNVSYDQVGALKRLLRPPQVALETETYGEEVRLEIRVGEAVRAEFEASLKDLGIIFEEE